MFFIHVIMAVLLSPSIIALYESLSLGWGEIAYFCKIMKPK